MQPYDIETLLRLNIAAVLKERRMTAAELTRLVGRSKPWLSRFLKPPQNPTERRGMRLPDVERVAKALGLQPHELLKPGISEYTERRRQQRRTDTERRQDRDRRVGHSSRLLEGLRGEHNKGYPSSSHGAPAVRPTAPPEEPLHRFVAKFEADLARYLADETRRQTTAPRVDLPKASAGNRKPRRSRAKTG